MKAMPPSEKLDMQTVDYQHNCPFKFLTSLPHLTSGWFANHALQRPYEGCQLQVRFD